MNDDADVWEPGEHAVPTDDRPRAPERPRVTMAGDSVRRPLAVAALLLTAALTVSSCTQPGKGSSHSGQGGHRSPSPSSSGSSAGGVSSGTQLGTMLTRAQLPAGWQLAAGVQPEHDSGPNLNPALGPQSQAHDCSVMDFSASALYFTDWWSVSYAYLTVQETQTPTNLANLVVAAYQPASDAVQTLSMATSLAGTCKSFTDSSGNSVTVSAQAVPGIGSQSLYLTSTGQTSAGTIVGQVLLAQTGRYVIGVDTDTGTSGPISEGTIEQLGSWLAGQVPSG
jgi:hypothetical protein